MNVSYRWLRALAPTITGSPSEIAERLGMLGAPVDEVIEVGAEIRGVVVARVDEVRSHPNADRLRLCTVDAGGPERLQVVCGAPNVEAGGYYPFAPVGASLPGGTTIRKAKLRGESSEGMLCSARELALGRDHEGLMALDGEWEPGAPFLEALGLDDTRLVLDVTANRPDLLSHVGVARELAPEGVAAIELAPFCSDEPRIQIRKESTSGEIAGIEVTIEDEDACPRYMAGVVRGVRVGASPAWLAARLRTIGLRPINNVVDATNYVLHELGQPLHAFDLDRLAEADHPPRVRIRRAAPDETIVTLDGVKRVLDAQTLVIAGAEHPLAIAGVMGGSDSEVTSATTNLFLECALFDPLTVRRAARRLGLSTDASYRYERGVDPELQPLALRRVATLITAVAGGTVEPIALDLAPAPFRRTSVEIRPARATGLLGVPIGEKEIRELLEPIGFEMEAQSPTVRLLVPGYRPDVTREVDLIEEVARRRGYDSFPEELRPFRPSNAPEDPLVAVMTRVRGVLGEWGFLEARTAPFSPDGDGRLAVMNPLSSEESHLRDALVPGLLRRLEHNWAHGVHDVRLYEIGTVFLADEDGTAREMMHVAAVFTGASRLPHWSGGTEPWDRWDVKGLLADVARALEAPQQPDPEVGSDALLDGTERWVIRSAEEWTGAGGRVAPAALDAPAWAGDVYAIEIELPDSVAPRMPVYQPLPEYPAIERDLALLLPPAITAEEVQRVIENAAGSLLASSRPFDLYTGAGIPSGTRSIAWRLTFRHPDRTLTDAEVDRSVTRALEALAEELDVTRR